MEVTVPKNRLPQPKSERAVSIHKGFAAPTHSRNLSLCSQTRSQIKLYDVIEEDKYNHLVLESCQGSKLFDRNSDRTVYSETDVAYVVPRCSTR